MTYDVFCVFLPEQNNDPLRLQNLQMHEMETEFVLNPVNRASKVLHNRSLFYIQADKFTDTVSSSVGEFSFLHTPKQEKSFSY